MPNTVYPGAVESARRGLRLARESLRFAEIHRLDPRDILNARALVGLWEDRLAAAIETELERPGRKRP